MSFREDINRMFRYVRLRNHTNPDIENTIQPQEITPCDLYCKICCKSIVVLLIVACFVIPAFLFGPEIRGDSSTWKDHTSAYNFVTWLIGLIVIILSFIGILGIIIVFYSMITLLIGCLMSFFKK